MSLATMRAVVRSAITGIKCSRRTKRNYLERKRRMSMFPKSEYSITLCATFCASLLFAATISALPQQTTTERMPGNATVSTSQLEGVVLLVEGNDLLVKLPTGHLRTFHVPETRRFLVDGKELSVHQLQTGTSLTATVTTTTTPVTVRTKSRLSGKVWYVAGTTVILTLADGQNKQYAVKDDVRFTVEGRPATVFDLRKGMNVSAEKIVEEPSVEITANTTVVGHAPASPQQAAAPPAPQPAPAAPEPTPAAPQPAATETKAPEASRPAAPETTEPTPQPAAPESASPAATQPTTPETGGGSTSPLVWLGLIAVLIIIVVIVVRKSRGKSAT
jgi:LPXTG-motif cell wall-anchored protein